MHLDNRYLIGGVAAGAAALTVHGSAHAAELAGVPAPWSYVYPVIGDLLAVAAWRATGAAERWRQNVARIAMVSAAAASGLAQGYALANGLNADGTARPAPLAWGMGIAPAVVVLVVTVLGSVAVRPAEGATEPVALLDQEGDTAAEEERAPGDPWADYSVPVSPPPPPGDIPAEATGDTRGDTTPPGDTTPGPEATGDTTPRGDTAAPEPGDIPAADPGQPDGDTSHDDGDTARPWRQPAAGEDPVAWLLTERRAGRPHTGVAVGRAYGRTGDAGARWGQRVVRTANEQPERRLEAVK